MLKIKGGKVQLSELVADLDEDTAIETVRRRLADGEDPFLIVDECQVGIMQVGQLYERGVYYVSGLIMAGEIMEQIGQLVLPVLQGRITGTDAGRILVGTVQGDIHYVGKNMFKVLLQCFGFTVLDAGEDVEPAEFLKQMRAFTPHVIGLSCLLTSAYDSMRETIALLRSAAKDFERPPRIIIGGAVDAMVCQYVEAEHWARDAMSGVRICQSVTKKAAGAPGLQVDAFRPALRQSVPADDAPKNTL